MGMLATDENHYQTQPSQRNNKKKNTPEKQKKMSRRKKGESGGNCKQTKFYFRPYGTLKDWKYKSGMAVSFTVGEKFSYGALHLAKLN